MKVVNLLTNRWYKYLVDLVLKLTDQVGLLGF